jgi:hypothetical protein
MLAFRHMPARSDVSTTGNRGDAPPAAARGGRADDARLTAIVVLLRIGACLTMAAFPMMFLPTGSMAAVHEWLGLGPFPRSTIVEYLTRSISELYGFHGVLLLIISTDVPRYRPLVTYVAVMNIVFGVMLLFIDLRAALPVWWTLFEGPPLVVIGAALASLNRPAAT